MEAIMRKSYHSINKVYFFTATIHKWLPLLADENNKQLIIRLLTPIKYRRLFNSICFCANA
jgi:hypothetical protein